MELLQPVILTGTHVRLEPLAKEHKEGLMAAVQDGDPWRLWYTMAPAPEAMGAEIDRRLALQAVGSMLPFTVIEPASGEIVGMTSYMNVDLVHHRVEIGTTWYAKRVQRTGLNTEAKLLLLRYAFERLACIAVEWRTHFMNHQSRRAIEGLGAKLDGILRSHTVTADGSLRDTCVYSVIASEWPAVRTHLEWQLKRPR
ncbi:MAG: GNAT family N-acetyltransferase [Janthinobacterium lividum]